MAFPDSDYAWPLSLLNDPHKYVEWQQEIGTEEAQSRIIAAASDHVREHGIDSAFVIAQKLQDCKTVLEEFK